MYYTIITNIGKAKLANATALGQTLNLTKMAVGDGNGLAVTPTEDMTELINQIWIGNLSDLRIDEKQDNWIIAESYIESDIGGFTVREVGLFDDENNLIAIGNYPDSYKPRFESGAAKDMLLRIIIEVTNSDIVELKIDPAIILATRQFVHGYARKSWRHIDKSFVNDGDEIAVNDFVSVYLNDGAMSLLLPAEPKEKGLVHFLDCTSSFKKHSLSIGRNGHTIMGLAEDMKVILPQKKQTTFSKSLF